MDNNTIIKKGSDYEEYKNIKYIQSIILSLILTSICIRIMYIELFNNSIVMPFLFTLFILIGFITNKKITHINKRQIPIIIIYIYILLNTIIYVCFDISLVDDVIKFILCIMVAFFASKMSIKYIKVSIMVVIYITFIFSIYAYLNSDTIIYQMMYTKGLNYLVVTLPIGCAATIALTNIYSNEKNRYKLIYLCMTIIFFISMFSYSGRGNILFPILTLIIIFLIKSTESLRELIKVTIFIFILYIGIIFLFENYASEYLQNRFSELFFDTNNESRVRIYSSYINYIMGDFNWMMGIGFKQTMNIFDFYPHNFMLELFGEYGIVGILLNIYLVVNVLINVIKSNKYIKNLRKINIKQYKNVNTVFMTTLGMLIYYFFTFFKSFSVYDAYQLFISMGLITAIKNELYTLLGGK